MAKFQGDLGAAIKSTQNDSSLDYSSNQTNTTTKVNTRTPDVRLVNEDGHAPAGMQVGDYVATAQGVYRITAARGGQDYDSERVEYYDGSRDTARQKVEEYRRLIQSRGFKKGGVVDFTGVADMHGTPSHSETVFNSTDASKLYDFVHTTPDLVADFMERMKRAVIPTVFGSVGSLDRLNPSLAGIEPGEATIRMGDIIINGNADDDTIEKISRTTRKDVNEALKAAGLRFRR